MKSHWFQMSIMLVGFLFPLSIGESGSHGMWMRKFGNFDSMVTLNVRWISFFWCFIVYLLVSILSPPSAKSNSSIICATFHALGKHAFVFNISQISFAVGSASKQFQFDSHKVDSMAAMCIPVQYAIHIYVVFVSCICQTFSPKMVWCTYVLNPRNMYAYSIRLFMLALLFQITSFEPGRSVPVDISPPDHATCARLSKKWICAIGIGPYMMVRRKRRKEIYILYLCSIADAVFCSLSVRSFTRAQSDHEKIK